MRGCNMKCKALLLGSMLLLGLASCSDLGVTNSSDSTIPPLPDDFDAKLYLQMNPDVFVALIQDSVVRHNASYLGADSLKDDTLFLMDTTTARWIKTQFHISDLMLNLATLRSSLETGLLESKYFRSKVGFSAYTYNFRGNPQDVQAYQNIIANVDSTLFGEYNYQYAGRYDGHPYRYCTAADTTLRNSATQAVSIKAGPGKTAFDFSAHTYCYNDSTKLIYMISNKLVAK